MTETPNSAIVLRPVDLPADRHPVAVYLAALSPGSRRTMRGALETAAAALGCPVAGLPWHRLGYQHTQAVRAVVADRYAPATANKILAAVRGVLHEAFRLGLMKPAAYARAIDLPMVRGSRLPAGRNVGGGELRAMYGAIDASRPGGARDAALLSVLYAAGLRRSEAVALELADWRDDDASLRVRGKGNKERIAFLTNGALDALRHWLTIRGSEPGALFLRVNRGGRIVPARISDAAVRKALLRVAARAGVDHFSPHDLRRTFVGDMLDAGADLAVVQRMAGHASPDTTSRYDRRGDAAKRKAAGLLHVPFVTPKT